jgi:hypothetical protein
MCINVEKGNIIDLIHYPKNTEGGNKRKYMQFFEKPK